MKYFVNEYQSQVLKMLSPREREYVRGEFKPETEDYARRLKCNIRKKTKKGWECLQDFALIVDHYLSKEELQKELCEIFSSKDTKITITHLYKSLWEHIRTLHKGLKFAELGNILAEKELTELNAVERRELYRFWKLSHGFDNLSVREERELYKACKRFMQTVKNERKILRRTS